MLPFKQLFCDISGHDCHLTFEKRFITATEKGIVMKGGS